VKRPVLAALASDDARPVISVVAPAGFGKTTLLAEWAANDARSFAWVSVDARDNDPRVLLAYVAEALNRVEPVGQPVFDALASHARSVSGSVVPRLAGAFAGMSSAVVLVFDDVHLLHNRESRSALSVLAEHIPAGSRLVLAGRDAPPLRIAKLRAADRITEVGPADLALSRHGAAALLLEADVTVGADDVAVLHERTEGWPVGLYLAALYLREGGSVETAAAAFHGDDHLVSEYIEAEFLEEVPAHHRAFLTRSAALERMSGALCEAALDLPDAAAMLADLARSNMLLVPLDRRGHWYRYHHLFGDMLRAELERREPETTAAVRRRAEWCLENDRPEEAVEYSIGAQDAEVAARLIEEFGFGVYWHGHRDRLGRWIHWLQERDAVKARPMIAVIAGFLCMSTLRESEAERWAGLLDRWEYSEPDWAGNRAVEAHAALLRVSVCRYGADQMRADVDEAVEKFAAEGIETPNLVVYRGLVSLLMGEIDTADALFQETIGESEQNDLQEILVCALYERSVLAMARGEWRSVQAFADRLGAALKRPGGSEEVFVWIVQARLAAHKREFSVARDALAHAQRLRPLMRMPVFAVQNRIELARAYLALNDLNGARTVMREIDEILQRVPSLGTLVNEAEAMRSRLRDVGRSDAAGPSSLTTAELRLLPMLCTHLTYGQIADELCRSRHTIRAQTKSIFRKLNTASRAQTVARCRELALLDG
jgi:LuxR family maltose regulon positive regulatory protein